MTDLVSDVRGQAVPESTRDEALSARERQACIWCGMAMAVLFVLAMWPLARFLPPPSPRDTVAQITHIYRSHLGGIRAASLLIMVAGGAYLPFCAAVSLQLRRIARRPTALAAAQLGAGAVNAMLFILLGLFWMVASFRAGRSPAEVQLFNDMGWIIMVVPTVPFIVQLASIGVVVLGDRREVPLLPRWVGYLNLWCVFLVMPGMLSGFFKGGPIAWNGVLSFWLEAAAFLAWLVTMIVLLLRAVAAERSGPA